MRVLALRYLLRAAGWAGMLGIVVAYAMGEFVETLWWAELFSHFRVFMVAGLALCLAFLLFARSWISGVICSVPLTLGFISVVWWYVPVNASPVSGERLRLCVANVLTTNDRYADTLDAIHGLEPDIAVLIEVTDEWFAAIEGDARWRIEHEEVLAYSGWIVILSPAEDAPRAIRAESVEMTPGTSNIPAVDMELELDGRPLRVLGVHSRSPSSRSNAADRAAQYGAIAAWAQRDDTPCVVAGDLNTTVWSPRYRELERDAGLDNAVRGHGTSRTWPGWLPSPLRIGIDHCLLTPGLVCTKRLHTDAGGSDHTPILFELAWAVGVEGADAQD